MSEPTSAGKRRGARRLQPVERTWLIRLGITLAVGIVLGVAAGIVAVNTLEPGRPAQSDALQPLIDSVQNDGPVRPADDRGAARGPTGADQQTSGRQADSAATESAVPDLVGADEGAARATLSALGLEVRGVEFRASASPAGTVLATDPPAGVRVARGTAVALVLSDGRSTDTLRTP